MILVGGFVGVYFWGKHVSAQETEAKACVAGPGEICPSDDFKQEITTFKTLAARQRDLSQNAKVKELIALIDQTKGMSERMQGEIQQTLNQNPGHQWDGAKEKFTLMPPQPAPQTPVASTTGPNSPAVTGNNNKIVAPAAPKK
jgi:hypothetical protein